MSQILIVEDEIKLASLLADYFIDAGFRTTLLHDGREVVLWLKENDADIMLLDIMLPGKDGMTVCREVREFSQIPILMVTARVDEIDRLHGLELGADDYICKPFSPREVVARVKAVLRRSQPMDTAGRLWRLDVGRFSFHYGQAEVALTSVEFYLLARLCTDPGRIYSRAQLMRDMYKDNRIVSDRTIDSHVKKIRAKLASISAGNEFIESVYGIGYRFLI
jgi:two-component system response regulator BaeR